MVATRLGLALLSLTAVCSALIPKGFPETLGDSPLSSRTTREFPRQAADIAGVSAAITNISNSLATANNTVVAFQGSIGGLIQVNSDVKTLGDTISTSTRTFNSTPRLNAQDSTTVGIAFLGVQPNINTLLKNLNDKQSAFDTAAFGLLDTRSLIHDTLVLQQNGASTLGNSLISILDPGIQGIAQPINDQIQSNFTAAVDFWAGRSGLIKIPTDLVPAATDLLAQLGPIIGQILPRDADEISAGAVSSRQNRGYCCGITQERINALGPDENAANDIPLPIRSAMSRAGLLF